MVSHSPARRIRFAAPSPRVKCLTLTAPDLVLFQAIDRHGPLPTNYLYAFTRHARRDRTHLQNRLTEFYNGDLNGAFLTRPPQQFASYRARYQHVVYDLKPRARYVLGERGMLTSYGQSRSDPFVHRLMAACASASLELAAAPLGLRYIPFQEILDHPRCGGARLSNNPLALPIRGGANGEVIPDLLFGLKYPEPGYRFFAVEIDRNTESIERKNLRQSAFARKIEGYVAALSEQSYRSWWGVPNLHVLTVTTNQTHGHKLLEHIRNFVPKKIQHRFAVKVDTSFGVDWRVPDCPLMHLLTEPWANPNGFRAITVA